MNSVEISIYIIIIAIIIYSVVKYAKSVDKSKNINIDLKKYDGINNANFNINNSIKRDAPDRNISGVRIIGCVIMIVGCVFVAYSLFMDVSVMTGNGYRVNNIGLMSYRNNFMMFGGFVAIAGLLVILFGNRKTQSYSVTKCPYCAEVISSEAIKCKHCGSDLKSML